MDTLVRKCSVRTGQLQRRQAACQAAQRRRKSAIVCRTVQHKGRDSHFLRVINSLVHADLLRNLDRRHVQ